MRISEETYIKKFNKKFLNFEYVSGYETYDSKIKVKCKICGHVQERHANSKSYMKCDNCLELERLEKIKVKEVERSNKARKEIEYTEAICVICDNIFTKQSNNHKYCSNECESKANSKRIIRVKICKECGNEFETDHDKTVYCSKRCSNRFRRKKSTISKDRRITLNGKADYSISLKKLYKRDKGICHICGENCDPKDYVEYGDIFIAGESYPSIDHVYPIAKGGMHSWDNVMLAHRYCNAVKNDKIISSEGTKQLRII